MYRLEIFLSVLFLGLLLSELVDGLARVLLRMYLSQSLGWVHSLAASAIFLLALVLLYCLGWLHPELRHLPPLHWLEREFNIFRKKVKIVWPSNWEAETTKTILFTFDPHLRDSLAILVQRDTEILHCTEVWHEDSLEVIFPARVSGDYQFCLTCLDKPVRGAPWRRKIVPGNPDPNYTRMVGLRSQTAVLPAGGSITVRIQLRDSFENHIEAVHSHCDHLQVIVDSDAFYEIEPTPSSPSYLQVKFSFTSQTCDAFPVSLEFQDKLVAKLQLLVLSPAKMEAVNNYVTRMGWNSYYELQLTQLHGIPQKPKTVYVYLTDRQVTVREFYLRLIPHKLATYRVAPQVSFSIQDKVLSIRQRDTEDCVTRLAGGDLIGLAAAYYTLLTRRTGGTETFPEKTEFFSQQLLKHHEELNHQHRRLPVHIDRFNVFESTYRASRHFLQSDWAKLWEIFFEGEMGVDQGGLRREWFDLVTKFIFDPENEMFVPLEEGAMSVGPNPFPPPWIKQKHYRLAGKLIGKALYESAIGETYRLNLNARLAQSLLAQVIGVGVHVSMLERDAPELWQAKVQFILGNPVNFLELTFTQEEIHQGGEVTTVELVPGGARIPVTDANKKTYISALARYLLETRVKSQVCAFLEGVHTLVPESLLTLWDEAELELLLCGVRDYSVADLKKHHTLVGRPLGRYGVVLVWFWEVLSHLGKEDLSRFAQFCTGSSLLPPGGFQALKPLLQISWGGGERGTLPTSHTCFNMIVLPDAENYQQLERVLLTAVREGSEGFLLA